MMIAARGHSVSTMQFGAGLTSAVTTLVFGALAAMMLFRRWDHFVAPLAEKAAAGRTAWSDEPFQISSLALEELPDVGPRSDSSAWLKIHAELANEIKSSNKGQGFMFILYGDSITETWRGTQFAEPIKRAEDGQEAFERYWGEYRTAALAIAGDCTGHLLWRLQNGELPDMAHQPRAVILLIGTNDLGLIVRQNSNGDPLQAAPNAVRRLLAVIGFLRKRLPQSHVVVAAVMPRGARGKNKKMDDHWPSQFTKAIEFLNQHVANATEGDLHVSYIDCNGMFLNRKGSKIKKSLMPDLLHPSVEGMGLLAECFQAELIRLDLM